MTLIRRLIARLTRRSRRPQDVGLVQFLWAEHRSYASPHESALEGRRYIQRRYGDPALLGGALFHPRDIEIVKNSTTGEVLAYHHVGVPNELPPL